MRLDCNTTNICLILKREFYLSAAWAIIFDYSFCNHVNNKRIIKNNCPSY